jgi:M penetrans paralogue family 26
MDELIDNGNSSGGGNLPLPNANATLVLGIISIATFWIYGIIGLICGIIAIALHSKDKRIYKTNPANYAGAFKNAKAGFICGIIGLSLSALYLIIVIIAIVFLFNSGVWR